MPKTRGNLESTRAAERRASGLVRTLVVASATLAILLVCYSIYEYSQRGHQVLVEQARPQHPSRPTPPDAWKRAVADSASSEAKGSSIGQMDVGEARGIRLSLYPREGTRSVMEIEVSRFEPTRTTANEFILFDPLIRLRTTDGRAVRVTANRGILQADRRGGGNLDPRRGHLSGDVLIEIDRLTEDERAALPEEQRNKHDASQLVIVELDIIEFDLEYSKIVIPRGGVHVSAADLDFTADDLEVWFNDEEGRIEYLRINDGGRLVLRELGNQLGMGWSGASANAEQRVSIVQWLQNAVAASLQAQKLMTTAEAPAPEAPEAEAIDAPKETGVPVFLLNAKPDEKKAKPAARYFVRLEGNVDVAQSVNGQVESRLQTDLLEILREVSDEDKQRAKQTPAGAAGEDRPATSMPQKTTTLKWDTRLTLQVCKPGDAVCEGHEGTTILATGSPTRLVSPEWQATCSHLRVQPDDERVWFEGTVAEPVVVQSTSAGVMSGLEVFTERTGNELYLRVKGPGTLRRANQPADETQRSTSLAGAPADGELNGTIEFAGGVEFFGRFIRKTDFSFTQGVVTKEERVLDRALFAGDVRLHEGDIRLETDSLTVHFATQKRWGGDRQTIERLEGRGNVSLHHLRDRVTCSEIDVTLTTDRNGRTIPLVATARGNVEATQTNRTIKASDRLVIDFEMVGRPPPPFDARKAHAAALAEGLDPSTVDWAAKRRMHEATRVTEVGVSRLRAFGRVVVVDPDQSLEIEAERLDCRVANGQEMVEAIVEGTSEVPASVRLDTFSVVGRKIKLNVMDQWAEVPGEGRMTFRSFRDLDGRELSDPIPISVTWREWMKYQGRENRAVFNGEVHATSQATTTFDCDRLLVEFEDAPADPSTPSATANWWIFDELLGRADGSRGTQGPKLATSGFRKKPAKILATGHASVETAEVDPVTGKLISRARLSGPSLSVDLRPNVSRMLIEGPGKLLLEDFRPAVLKVADRGPAEEEGLFSLDGNAGPSKTLIEWDDAMWYDFSIDQTWFEGNVRLKHFSGSELEKIFGQVAGGSSASPQGRSTFLRCDVLTVDFLDRSQRALRNGDQRMGGLSSDRLRQFQASGAVELRDKTEGLFVQADTIVFEKARQLLQVYGTSTKKAHIVYKKPGEPPNVFSTERLFYDLVSKRFDIYKPTFTRGQ